MSKVVNPNYTQVPNAILDALDQFSDSEVRILMAMCRQTFGWQRGFASLIICKPFLMKAAGLSDRGVFLACKSLEEKGYLEIVRAEGSPNCFRLIVLETEDSFTKRAPEAMNDVHDPHERCSRPPMNDVHGSNIDKETVKKIDKESFFLEQIPEELKTPEFEAAWQEWKQHRKESGKKLTSLSVSKQMRKLSAWGVERAIAAINNSIENSYQGIFEPSNNVQRNGKQTEKPDYSKGWA
jgi:hypothetical protein